ncbi:aldehyde dehydrogenase family protein [Jatrophihabitans fulvus]
MSHAIHNPARPHETVGSVELLSRDRVEAAVGRAHAARAGWRRLDPADRIASLTAAMDAVGPASEDLVDLLVRENGKVRAEAAIDLGGLRGLLTATAMFADVLEPRSDDAVPRRLVHRRRPLGVVLVLVPFNAPVALAAAHVMPALIAGNPVVVKVPLLAPLAVTEVLGRLARALPDGVVEVVTCTDDLAGAALVGDRRIRKIGLTGGARTAVAVLNSLRDVKELSFELGGNDAAVLLEDAPVTAEIAERLTAGALSLNGQYCSAVKRVYVHRSRLAELTDALADAFDKVVVGDGLDPQVTLGPVISRASVERSHDLVADAVERGGRAIAGGRMPDAADLADGYFVRPTLVADAVQDCALVQEEQFAPVLPIIAFDDDDTAIAMVNDDDYGLGAGVWSIDEERAADVAARLDVGIAIVNGTAFDTKDLRTPFGGSNQSGIGRLLAGAGLEAYSSGHVVVHGDLNRSGSALVGR